MQELYDTMKAALAYCDLRFADMAEVQVFTKDNMVMFVHGHKLTALKIPDEPNASPSA